jgi:hypothetical protein
MIKRQILFNSKDRTSGTSSSFMLQYRLRQFSNCDKYYVTGVSIPFSYYVVNSSNNVLTFLNPGIGSNSTVITIPPGNYSFSQLQSTIQTSISAINSQFTITYNVNTGLYSFSTTTQAFGLDASASTSILSNLMGFLPQVYPASTSTITSTNVADLSGPKYLYVVSNALAFQSEFEAISSNPNIRNVICAIPVNVNSFEIIIYENHDDADAMPFHKPFPNIIDIQLIDCYGNPINLNGCEWSFTIEGFFTDFVFTANNIF